jgi:hypothetical protein
MDSGRLLTGLRSIANVGFLPRGAGAIATPPTRRALFLLDARHPAVSIHYAPQRFEFR